MWHVRLLGHVKMWRWSPYAVNEHAAESTDSRPPLPAEACAIDRLPFCSEDLAHEAHAVSRFEREDECDHREEQADNRQSARGCGAEKHRRDAKEDEKREDDKPTRRVTFDFPQSVTRPGAMKASDGKRCRCLIAFPHQHPELRLSHYMRRESVL